MIGAVRSVRQTLARVEAREKQLAAWAHMLDARVVRRTRAALAFVHTARLLAFVVLAVAAVRWTVEAGYPTWAAFPVLALGWCVVDAPRLVAADRILARAFATMTPPAPRTSAPPAWAPSVRAAAASSARATTVSRRKRAKRVERDRDALDFDDAA